MDRFKIEIGEKVLYNQIEAIIIGVIDLSHVSIQELKNNIIHTVKITSLQPFMKEHKSLPNNHLSYLTEKEWERAKKRYKIIKPLLENKKNLKLIEETAKLHNIHRATIYRWIKLYNQTGVVSSLAGFKKTGGKGKSRLPREIDQVIDQAIEKLYLNPSKKSINRVIREVQKICHQENLKTPHANTIRNRIKNISEEELIKSRYGKNKARDKFEPIKQSFPGADYPLSVVQIDHTVVDIILVDELYRKPFIRPWITVAIDVYSRMVLGFHLSFDPPGSMGTGSCLSNAILTKENWMEKNGVEGEWPCWGLMKTVHADNAKEFQGNMLRKACLNYGIDLEFRPGGQPQYGGHIERLLGTFSKEIHNLPGTTFSDKSERENYNSEKNASLTISELEKWLMTYIVNIYHKRIHRTIQMSPLQKYQEGIFGDKNKEGVGVPDVIIDERRLRLDFMPYIERTIQEYGVVIDHIYYYHDVLRKYIHSKESLSKYSSKRKFMFRRDPRDISTIYFYDPELNEYFEIPYRDASNPAISIWEYNEVVRNLNKNKIVIDEESIFNGYRTMEEIELKAIQETKRLKRTSRYADKRELKLSPVKTEQIVNKNQPSIEIIDIKPFEDIEDEAFT